MSLSLPSGLWKSPFGSALLRLVDRLDGKSLDIFRACLDDYQAEPSAETRDALESVCPLDSADLSLVLNDLTPSLLNAALEQGRGMRGRRTEVMDIGERKRFEPGPVQEDDKDEPPHDEEDLEMLLNLPRTWNVFVGDLKPGVTEEDLMELFLSCGPIDTIRVIRDKENDKPKGYGFIHFKSEEAQKKALSDEFNHISIKGRPCRVKSSEEKVTLFIGNLPIALDQEQARQALEDLVGTVYQCELKTGPPPDRLSRGFCFTTFANHRLADRARRILLQSRVQGRLLKVSWADGDSADRREVADDIMSKVRTLYVSNIPVNVAVESLRQLFGHYGKLTNCVIVRHPITKESRGFAFVEYQRREDLDQAVIALDGHIFEGQELSVTLAKPPPNASARDKDPIKTVYVANLPIDVDSDRLQEVFLEYGDVVSCKVVRHKETQISKGYGFVEYKDRHMADAACESRHLTMLDGKEISVTIANPPAAQRPKGINALRPPVFGAPGYRGRGGMVPGRPDMGGYMRGHPLGSGTPGGYGYPPPIPNYPASMRGARGATSRGGPAGPGRGVGRPGMARGRGTGPYDGYPGAYDDRRGGAGDMSSYDQGGGAAGGRGGAAPAGTFNAAEYLARMGYPMYQAPGAGQAFFYNPAPELFARSYPFAGAFQSPFAAGDAAEAFYYAYQLADPMGLSASMTSMPSLSDFDFHLDMSTTTLSVPPAPETPAPATSSLKS